MADIMIARPRYPDAIHLDAALDRTYTEGYVIGGPGVDAALAYLESACTLLLVNDFEFPERAVAQPKPDEADAEDGDYAACEDLPEKMD